MADLVVRNCNLGTLPRSRSADLVSIPSVGFRGERGNVADDVALMDGEGEGVQSYMGWCGGEGSEGDNEESSCGRILLV